jgi:TetR/AcrR family transcriptional regulator
VEGRVFGPADETVGKVAPETTKAASSAKPAAPSGKRQSRRRPRDQDRQRDPAGTRHAILAAADAELGAH